MQRRVLSSKGTVFYKFVVPVIYLLIAIDVLWPYFFRPISSIGTSELVMLGGVSVIVLLYVLWNSFSIHKVEMDDENFYISNYRKEITVPISDLYEATV